MNKILLLLPFLLLLLPAAKGQEHTWAFGVYSDINLQAKEDAASVGMLGKYDLSKRSGVQALIHGRRDFVSVGADYIFTVLDKTKSNFNVYLGGGISQDFYGETTTSADLNPVTPAFNTSVVNGQAGISYYFAPVKLSLFSGYKLKHMLKDRDEDQNSHNLTIGLRYHLW